MTAPWSANRDRSTSAQDKTTRQRTWEDNHKVNPKFDWEYAQAATVSVPLHDPDATAEAASNATEVASSTSAAPDDVLLPGQKVSLDDEDSDSEY